MPGFSEPIGAPNPPDRYHRRVHGDPGDGEGGREEPLRVLMVIKCLGYGGAERLLADMVSAGDGERFHYEVAYILRAQDALAEVVERGGTPVHALDAVHDADLRWMASLRRILAAGRFDVVHFHLPYAAALGQMVVRSLPRSHRPGVVYTEHSLWNRAPLPLKVMLRASMSGGQQMVTVSQASYEALPETMRRRATMVVHGVDLSRAGALVARREELRADVRAELGVVDDDVLFLTVANLRAEKGYDVLLEAARLLAARRVPITIAAVGRGPLGPYLRARHLDLELGDRFRFLGQRTDVLRLLGGADAFVLASHQEGLPVALMEASSMGLPIVATAVGGVPQALRDGIDALIVPPGDAGRVAAAMERLATDPGLRRRLGDQAKERSAMFDVAEASRRIEEIYLRMGGES